MRRTFLIAAATLAMTSMALAGPSARDLCVCLTNDGLNVKNTGSALIVDEGEVTFTLSYQNGDGGTVFASTVAVRWDDGVSYMDSSADYIDSAWHACKRSFKNGAVTTWDVKKTPDYIVNR